MGQLLNFRVANLAMFSKTIHLQFFSILRSHIMVINYIRIFWCVAWCSFEQKTNILSLVGVVLEEAIECSRFKLKTIEDCRFYNVEPEAGWLNTKQAPTPHQKIQMQCLLQFSIGWYNAKKWKAEYSFQLNTSVHYKVKQSCLCCSQCCSCTLTSRAAEFVAGGDIL